MKAVVLCAGVGKRLRPITSTQPKPMIPLVGKPLLEHTILGLKNAGITEILLIVGYKENLIKEYFGNGIEKFNVKLKYVTQEEQLGTAHAFRRAKNFANNESLLFMYGDILVETDVFQELIKNFSENKVNGIMLLLEIENPEKCGIVSLNPDGLVDKIIEKPTPEMNAGNLASAGIFIFDPRIFQAIDKTKKSIRGEYEFVDSMEILITHFNGKIVGYTIKDYFWRHIGLPWQILDVNSYLLNQIEKKILGKIDNNVQISGEVYIGEGTIVRSGSYIQGPCYIGNNNLIGPKSFIRPYTFIANDCYIGRGEIKNSIVLSKVKAPHFICIEDTIICENVSLGVEIKVANLRIDNKNISGTIRDQQKNSRRKKLCTIIGPNVKTGINVSIMPGIIIGENSKIKENTIVSEDIPPNTLYYSNNI